MRYEAERTAVLETAKRMAKDGLVKLTSGNVSCRISGTDYWAITPSGMDYEAMTPEDVVVLDLQMQVIDGKRLPSSERRMHRMAYERRPDVNAVVHTHSIYASAFACLGQSLPIISIELACLVGVTVPCAPYAQAGTDQFADVFGDTLGQENMAVLLQNHGVTAVGASLSEAYSIATGLEEAAMIYHLAKQMGTPIVLPEEERTRMFREFRLHYGQPKS